MSNFTTPPPRPAVRRPSRIQFDPQGNASIANLRSQLNEQFRDRDGSVEWNVPDFSGRPANYPHIRHGSVGEFPFRQNEHENYGPTDARRTSNQSEATLAREEDDYRKYSFSSYQHPYDIRPPQHAYTGPDSFPPPPPPSAPRRPSNQRQRSVSFAEKSYVREYQPEPIDPPDDPAREREEKRRGVLGNLVQLYKMNRSSANEKPMSRITSSQGSEYSDGECTKPRPDWSRKDSMNSNTSGCSDYLDPDDPRVTGIKREYLEDKKDVEKNIMRQMDYKSRQKLRQKVKIEFNITSMVNREEFLMKLARALMSFGAPSHRIESQLISAARILEVRAEFIHLPGVILCSFGDQETQTSETHFVKCGGRLSLGALHKVHLVYRQVVHDEISAKGATELLDELLAAPPLYPAHFRCLLAFLLSALICPLAFGGSFLDMWVAGFGAFILSFLQLYVAAKSAMYANVFEITIAIFVSFSARGLSSIRSQIFCYSAISSSGIVGILPGYLILSSSLELASKNILCGSVKMVYALIYTLFLGFGLQIGSDLYLLLDKQARRNLDNFVQSLATTVSMAGSWLADNGTSAGIPLTGTYTFTHSVHLADRHILQGCYRAPDFPWYLKPFPSWTEYIIVPIFSLLSSLANLQPLKSKQLPVMVVISCCSYASNRIANNYIFNRSDVVSAIGAFTVGVLGNVYSRKMGGTAFTSMVTGVLFLVPSGLSQAGGISASGNGTDIGGAMIAVTIGITVGLFMSQAIVYMFGSRKNAAVFSF